MIHSFLEWTMWIFELYICVILTVEYYYDYNKDVEKKVRKTRTTKKTTTQPGGISVVDETSEVSEVMPEEIKK